MWIGTTVICHIKALRRPVFKLWQQKCCNDVKKTIDDTFFFQYVNVSTASKYTNVDIDAKIKIRYYVL